MTSSTTHRRPTPAVRLALSTVVVTASGIAIVSWAHEARSHVTTERVVGTLQTVGGPAPGLPRNVGGTVVFQRHGRAPITAVVDEHGMFAIRVPPGTYTVVGLSPHYYTGPCDGVDVTVPSARPVRVYCQEA